MKFEVCSPILGFENLKHVDLEKIDDVFMRMSSLEDEHITFSLIDPFVLRDYDFEVPDSIEKILGINKESNLIILNIILVQTPVEETIINFAAPMVFNTDNMKAAQVVLNNPVEYNVAEKISKFLNR